MIALAPRILNLPADVRAALARVDGPGWYFSRRDGATALHDCAPYVLPEPLGQRGEGFTEAWFSANPAASVAAVTGWSLMTAHDRISSALYEIEMDDPRDPRLADDHAAALSIIEAHVANRGPPMSDSTETPGLAAAREARKELVAALRDCHLVVAHQAANEVEALAADLSALRIEHGAVCGLLADTRRDRDEAQAHNAELRTHDASVIKAQARGYEAGVRAAANVVACAPVCQTEGECYACDRARDILALLEPKP